MAAKIMIRMMAGERMSDVDVCPTRMELLNVDAKLTLSRRGHDMLKKKRDTLIREYGIVLRERDAFRGEVDARMRYCFRSAKVVEMEMGGVSYRNIAYNKSRRIVISTEHEKVVGVKVPVVDAKLSDDEGRGYSFSGTPAALDGVVDDFREAGLMVVKLAALDKKVHVLMDEIKRTRRKVNALEKVKIKNLSEAHKYIRSYLDEREREDYSRLKHIKEVIKGENEGVI